MERILNSIDKMIESDWFTKIAATGVLSSSLIVSGFGFYSIYKEINDSHPQKDVYVQEKVAQEYKK